MPTAHGNVQIGTAASASRWSEQRQQTEQLRPPGFKPVHPRATQDFAATPRSNYAGCGMDPALIPQYVVGSMSFENSSGWPPALMYGLRIRGKEMQRP